jgi:hypothetical protein
VSESIATAPGESCRGGCIEPGGKGMSALVIVEDPDTFNAPLTMTRRWFKFEGPMLETVCPENNGDFFKQNLFPQPEAKTPDF